MRKLKLLLISVVVSLAPTMLFALPAHAASRLGGVSMAGACQNQWPGSDVVLLNNTVYGWKCRFWSSLGPTYWDINVTKQCNDQYHKSNAYGAFSDYNNPYSWSCYTP
jgi:hypothetical protein